jgi:ElaB/YqjD/DUF883 family membrane-anchored ribosome-binding protein
MKNALAGNGHAVTVHSEFESSPRSASNLLQQFRYRIQNNRTVRRAKVSVERAAHYVHDHSPKDMAAGIERLVRQRPGTALMIAAVAGFLIGRSLRRR